MSTSSSTTHQQHKLINGGIEIGGWRVTSSKKPILNSSEREQWEKELKLNELPEMVFGNNYISISRQDGSLSIVFNTYDALSMIQKHTDHSIKVSSAKRWEEINKGFGGSIEKEFDWTYTTHYPGTVVIPSSSNNNNNDNTSRFIQHGDANNTVCQVTTEMIDIEKLKQPDPILFFEDVIMFEDELADNGVSILSVKIRVMDKSLFVLQRFFLRVDDVILRCHDTRLYHEFDKPYALRECTLKEGPYDGLKQLFEKDPTTITNINLIANQIPTKQMYNEKIIINK